MSTIASVTQVRDESDIIELFIRINSKVIDKFFIIDNDSCDGTAAILKKLQDEGYNLQVVLDKNMVDDQTTLITQALQFLTNPKNPNRETFDWWVFPDADEFFSQSKEDILKALQTVPGHLVPLMKWKTWVPKNGKYLMSNCPLFTNFNPLKEEVPVYKVAIDLKRAPFSKIAMGAHSLHRADNDRKIDTFNSGIILNHFPVRSADQITSKSILTAKRMGANPNLTSSRHPIIEVSTQVRLANYKINEELLKELAINYGCLGSEIVGEIDDTTQFGTVEDKIRYKDLINLNVLKRFDYYLDCVIGRYTDETKYLRDQLKKAPKATGTVLTSMGT